MFLVAYFVGSKGGGPYGFLGAGVFTTLFWAEDLDILIQNITIIIQ